MNDLTKSITPLPDACPATEGLGSRAEKIALAFALSMMLTSLVLPFVYASQELLPWRTALQVALWMIFSGTWIYLGDLMERSGTGVSFQTKRARKPPRFGTRREILVFLLAFAPSCFAYVYVAYLNTGYLGFNYVLFFVVAGFSTHFFPFWLVIAFLLLETVAWNFLGRLLWGEWMRIDNLVTSLSGFLFSAMMFYLLRGERASRFQAEALSRELDEANEKLRAYSGKVEELSATQERNRIAREIHDTLGHSLTVVNMQLETAKALLAEDAERAGQFLEKAQMMTKKGLSDVRASVASLRAAPLEGLSLENALQSLLEATRATGLDADFQRKGNQRPINGPVAAALYRSAQEGLTNVRKHARASRVTLELDYSVDGLVTMSLVDDGIGCGDPTGGFGIVGIRERIHLLDGESSITSTPGKGLELRISVSA